MRRGGGDVDHEADEVKPHIEESAGVLRMLQKLTASLIAVRLLAEHREVAGSVRKFSGTGDWDYVDHDDFLALHEPSSMP